MVVSAEYQQSNKFSIDNSGLTNPYDTEDEKKFLTNLYQTLLIYKTYLFGQGEFLIDNYIQILISA